MSRRSRICGTATVALVTACSTSSSTRSPSDASVAVLRDAATDGESGLFQGLDVYVKPDVATVTPVGNALATVSGAVLRGVTDDGYVAFIDGTGAVSVVNVDGGAPLRIASFAGADADVTNYTDVVVSHDFVAIWNGTVSALAPASLQVWSHQLGNTKQLSTGSPPGVFQAAADSSFFTYLDDVSVDGNSAALYAALADATGKRPIEPSIAIASDAMCPIRQAFGGTYLVVASCALASSGAAAPSVTSFNVASSFAAAVLASSAIDQIAIGPDGANVLLATSSGALEYVPIGGGAAVAVDPGHPVSVTPASNATLFMAANPTRAIYQATDGALNVALLPSGAVSTLATGSVGTIFGLSPDGTAVSYATPAVDLMSGYPLDVSVLSTVAGGTVVPLDRGNPAEVFYDLYAPDVFDGTGFTLGTAYPFTSDGTYALLTTVPAGTDDDKPPGSLQATPVAGGTTVTIGASTVFAAVPVGGTKLVWNDSYRSQGNAIGGAIADLRVVDVATNQPTLIIAAVDADFALSPDRTKAIYTLNSNSPTDGVYVVALP